MYNENDILSSIKDESKYLTALENTMTAMEYLTNGYMFGTGLTGVDIVFECSTEAEFDEKYKALEDATIDSYDKSGLTSEITHNTLNISYDKITNNLKKLKEIIDKGKAKQKPRKISKPIHTYYTLEELEKTYVLTVKVVGIVDKLISEMEKINISDIDNAEKLNSFTSKIADVISSINKMSGDINNTDAVKNNISVQYGANYMYGLCSPSFGVYSSVSYDDTKMITRTATEMAKEYDDVLTIINKFASLNGTIHQVKARALRISDTNRKIAKTELKGKKKEIREKDGNRAEIASYKYGKTAMDIISKQTVSIARYLTKVSGMAYSKVSSYASATRIALSSQI